MCDCEKNMNNLYKVFLYKDYFRTQVLEQLKNKIRFDRYPDNAAHFRLYAYYHLNELDPESPIHKFLNLFDCGLRP